MKSLNQQLQECIVHLFEHVFEGIIFIEVDGTILYANGSAAKIVGYQKEELVGKNVFEFVDDNCKSIVQNHIGKNYSKPYKVKVKKRDGSNAWVLVKGRSIQLFGTVLRIVSIFDISEIVEKDNLIDYLSNYDLLTGLYNRKFFLEYIQEVLSFYTSHSLYGTIFFIDIDDFREINEIRGHEIGDLLLKEIKKRLQALVKTEALIARAGGDEFLIFCDLKEKNRERARIFSVTFANRLRKELEKPYCIEDQTINITVSIGIALIEPNLDIATLLKQVDVALYNAKEKRRNRIIVFNSRYLEMVKEKSALKEKIKAGLKRGEFFLAFQKKVRLQNGSPHIVGYEALIRWERDGEIISPAKFIPIAEENGLIIEIGEYVLRAVCSYLQNSDTKISVNISPRQFEDELFVKRVKEIINEYSIEPNNLIFEITENILLENIKEAIVKIIQLKKFGISFSIDDFGTGFSSFEYLKTLPLSELKIDQMFVKNIVDNSNDYAIVEAMTKIGHIFELQVVAEGVETKEQLQILQKIGVDVYQGYYFGKPEINQFIRSINGIYKETF
ncbi:MULTISPECIES: GGDEF domain-containing phosphodiesterase [unclassified Nitratiruptor]|uniref:sensor domain-containing protein n=1 Tax=unclassified Nitratiruptor TaxID=2624044 RepID=UPI0019158B94|nr:MULTISPECIES: GGDEF domain-containing phosphodiesterase [unclassified Nitratiruptor]BCD60073.1 diguanylate cyclase/phosphodiesterase [Nitratiruptor sp. YY08-10]BCD64438.1 diguanylate cyclase/phosphodiesterase [Nitratiruptor sp. YY08-14]